MFNKRNIINLVTLLILVVIGGVLVVRTNNTISELESSNNDLEKAQDEIQKEYRKLDEEYYTLVEEHNKLKDELDTLESTNDELLNEIGTLESKNKKLQDKINKQPTRGGNQSRTSPQSTSKSSKKESSGIGSSKKGKLIGTFEATHYCGCEICNGKWVGSPTASGKMPQVGRTIAVDTNVIPLGTTVLADGKEYVAEDTGSSVKGNIIDIFVGSHSEALKKGRKKVKVYRR